MNVYLFLTVIACLIYFQAVAYSLYAKPRSKVNMAFAACAFSLGWFALFLLIMQGQEEASGLYFYDRIAVFGWATFPAFLAVLFYFLVGESRRFYKITIFYFLLPFSAAIIARYLYDAESVKIFYLRQEIWYYAINRASLWAYIFPLYLLACGTISVSLVYKWLVSGKTNKEKLQARVVFLSLVVFIFFSLLTNIVLPFGNRQDLPPMAHFNFTPLIVGLFFSLTSLRFEPFNREVLSRFVAKNLEAFVVYFSPTGTVLGANQYVMRKLGYSQASLSKLEPAALVANLDELQKGDGMSRVETWRQGGVAKLVTSEGNVLPVRSVLVRASAQRYVQSGRVFIGLEYGQVVEAREQLQLVHSELSRLTGDNNHLELLVKQRKQELATASEQLIEGRFESRRISGLDTNDLKGKEQLVKEIHHRVKNNMQMVISLVNMLKNHKDISPVAAGRLDGITDLVRYISAIHEDFYSTPYLSKIDFGQFLHKATGELNGQVRPSRKILFNLNVTAKHLPVDLALPCGLVFHELLKNALKHAFPDAGSDQKHAPAAHVNIEFYRNENTYTLIVSDNGVGIPEGDPAGQVSGTMGLNLVHALVRDHLKGEMEISRNFGTIARVWFNHRET